MHALDPTAGACSRKARPITTPQDLADTGAFHSAPLPTQGNTLHESAEKTNQSAHIGKPSQHGKAPTITRKGVLIAALLVTVGSVCIQLSSYAASQTFADIGSAAASSGRMFFAAIVLLVLFRPRLRGRSRSDWTGVAVYGASMAVMNLSLMAAVARIPLGIAVTIEFLGPCVVALIASRKILEGLCAVLALSGVVLIAGPSGDANMVGILFALGAAVSMALYTVAAEKVGKSDGGMGNLALSVTFAAILVSPFGISQLHNTTGTHVKWLIISAVCGAVIGYGADTLAAKVTSGRVIGTLFAMDPVTGSIIGWLVMHQTISTSSIVGIIVVAASGALLVWVSGGRRPAPDTAPHIAGVGATELRFEDAEVAIDSTSQESLPTTPRL